MRQSLFPKACATRGLLPRDGGGGMKASNSKLQAPEKSQASISKAALEFSRDLVFGAWSFSDAWKLMLGALLLLLLMLCLNLSASAAEAEPPVIPTGLDAYRQWDRWPYQRIGARAYMRSTYDRRGGNEGADASHFLFVTTRIVLLCRNGRLNRL